MQFIRSHTLQKYFTEIPREAVFVPYIKVFHIFTEVIFELKDSLFAQFSYLKIGLLEHSVLFFLAYILQKQ